MKPGYDPHNFKARLSRIEAAIQRANIPRADKRILYDFELQLFADGLGKPRIVKYLMSIKRLYDLAPWTVQRANRRQILSILANIERQDWQAWTRHDYKLALRRYLTYCRRQDLAQLVRLPQVHAYKLPEELLSLDDILAILAAARSVEDRALVYVLYESGARIGELLHMQRKHVTFDSQGAVLIVSGKTGMRRLRIIEAAAVLDEQISSRSLKPDDRVFQNTYTAKPSR